MYGYFEAEDFPQSQVIACFLFFIRALIGVITGICVAVSLLIGYFVKGVDVGFFSVRYVGDFSKQLTTYVHRRSLMPQEFSAIGLVYKSINRT